MKDRIDFLLVFGWVLLGICTLVGAFAYNDLTSTLGAIIWFLMGVTFVLRNSLTSK